MYYVRWCLRAVSKESTTLVRSAANAENRIFGGVYMLGSVTCSTEIAIMMYYAYVRKVANIIWFIFVKKKYE